MKLTELNNIGEKLEKQLIDIGVTTAEELKSKGSRQAWLEILSNDPSACYMRLCALEGAIQGVRWHSLNDTDKIALKTFYHEIKK